MRLKLSREALIPPRPDKKIYLVHDANKREDIKQVVEQHLTDTGLWREAVSILEEGPTPPTPQQVEQAQAAMALALVHTADHTVGSKALPGEGRQKSHTWKVVKAYQAKEKARKHLAKQVKCHAPRPQVERAATARAEARRQFKKVLRDEVKKMVSKVLDTAKEEGTGEWSKQAQALVNRLTCSTKGEKDVADYGTMDYPPGNKEVASGPVAVGELASKYFHRVSEYDADCAEFDPAFERSIRAAVQDIKDQHLQEGATAQHVACPSHDEIRMALKDAGKKIHKAPGEDGVCNWMLVWGC